LPNLEKAIDYAKTRDVAIHLTLNTLLKNDELMPAVELAQKAYEFGVDAIIVQDLGLAKILMKEFPDLPLHASTQMTIHNLDGVLTAQTLGFKRVVLSRELSLPEISYICDHSDIEIETFIHGALCISYSGRCLFSSMVGGRSGNRGKCAGPCRLPYELLDENSHLSDKGYLLSPKDFCGLNYIPSLINAGVSCFKIEGRMKTPEYVATVTKIYRKYIDEFLEKSEINIQEKDKIDLMQVFNRGGFSSGHLEPDSQPLIFKEKSNNMGILAGSVAKYHPNKGHIFLSTNTSLSVGDTIMVEKENTKYTISELMINEKNVSSASDGFIEIGRMKGNINVGDKIYKLADKALTDSALLLVKSENKKIKLNAQITIKENELITLYVVPLTEKNSFYQDVRITVHSDTYVQKASSLPATKEQIISRLSKTGETPFEFQEINVSLEDGLFIPVSTLNQLRRKALDLLEETILKKYKRTSRNVSVSSLSINNINPEPKITLQLNQLDLNKSYENIELVDNIYIPFSYFLKKDYKLLLEKLSCTANLYIYFPSIIRNNYHSLIEHNLKEILGSFSITGLVLQNLGDISLLESLEIPIKDYDIVANDTLNVFHNHTIEDLKEIGFNRITASQELNKLDLLNLDPSNLEIIVYGRTPLMTTQYCLLGKTNHCSLDCNHLCKSGSYILKDRLGFLFNLSPDSIDTVTTIYNSKITSIPTKELKANTFRISILDESIEEINNIIKTVREGNKMEGSDYTNGSFSREV